MAEAAAKEPSMEDILSSIRKIIADDGDADATPDELAARSNAPESEPSANSMDTVQTEEEPIAEQPERPESSQHLPVERDPEPEVAAEADNSSVSLASIAASLQSSGIETEDTVAEMQEPEMAEQPEVVIDAEPQVEEVNHVEMAEATPPPVAQAPAEPEVAAMPPAVEIQSSEDTKREEDAFRGALMSPSVDNAVSGSFERLKRSAMDDIEAKTEAILRPMLREWLDENLPTLVEKMVREEIERVARG